MKQNKGFTLIELLISAVLSGVVVLGLISGLVLFTGRATQERTAQKLQGEVELALRWIRTEIEGSILLPDPSLVQAIPGLPGPVQLALVIPQDNEYVLVIYCLGLLPEGFPYDDPGFQRKYGTLQSALYRWQSPAFEDINSLPDFTQTEISSEELELVTAYLQPYNETNPAQSGLAFIPAEGEQGGLLMINGLRPLDFKGEGKLCATQPDTGQCKAMRREVYVYPKNSAPSVSTPPTEDSPSAP